ncbi:response regulator transcription factor [Mucilaginibacter terrae]|uniref:Two-component system copper resistance phosphate regulon response regulator CusR n=1 Tax=Mucilaginibacter terrae TaxID=1955052 RepID=A0ABU3GUD6_9SPHI|nr:response regulator transcription factor [Mucilaginibacter terrae]MDT3403396.1 two-component system copper resistance phosphate regulon response regulator CusR [Mucilaginibacter terrae]
MALLLVEDEPNVVSVIKRGLADYNFEVSVAGNGLTGLQMALSHPFDIIMLDVMLPGMDGIQICRRIRDKDAHVPILMLTALDSTENIVTGLDSGADDYMVKPFKIAELAARLRTLMRRRSNDAEPENTVYKIADLEVDVEAKTVYQSNLPLNLTPTEYRLLEYFIKNQKKVLSRIQILENVWDIDFNLGTNVVDVYVNYLRKKLEKNSPHKLINTVFGMGYMMKENEVHENSK